MTYDYDHYDPTPSIDPDPLGKQMVLSALIIMLLFLVMMM